MRGCTHRPTRKSAKACAAGVRSSVQLHAQSAARQYGLKTVETLVELCRRKMLGGREDMTVDVALDLLARADAAPAS